MNIQTLDFIRRHADDDVRKLALAGRKSQDVDIAFALQQIAGRQAAKQKVPSWAATEGVLYPPHLSMEQCSSEQTARYKAQLVHRLCLDVQWRTAEQNCPCGELSAGADTTLVDLTGGLGVDFSFMAKSFQKRVYVERQQQLCDMAQHNFSLLVPEGAEVVCGDGTDYLHRLQQATIVYLDPARRDVHGSKTVAISDCTPDVLALKDELVQKSCYTLVKLSPMLDWHQAVALLNQGGAVVCEVHIVSVKNECKELLFVLSKSVQQPFKVYCVNDDETFIFIPEEDAKTAVSSVVLGILREGLYLYEPHASMMKAGCFAALARQFGVEKVAPNSHLFLSAEKIDGFPGRQFKIMSVSSMNKKTLKDMLSDLRQANVAVRNFPLSVAELRKRLKLKDGGEVYLFATTDAAGRHVLLRCIKPV